MASDNDKGLRVDRWLWFARFYKTRTQASAAVRAGHVRVDGRRARPNERVAPGLVIEVVKRQLRYRLRVLSLPARRGSAAEAQHWYQEDSEIRDERAQTIARLRQDRASMPRTRGKPDKRTRRLLRRRNRGGSDDTL